MCWMVSFYQKSPSRHFSLLYVVLQAKMSLLGRKVTIPTFAKKKRATVHFPIFAKIYGRSLLLQTDHHFFPTFAYFSSIASILFNGVEKLFFGRAFQWSKLFPPLESFPLTVPFVAAESWILYNVY